MAPPNGANAIGAMWYNSIMTTSVCPNEVSGGYYAKPDGFETAKDHLNFAVVLKPGLEGVTLRATSNGQVLSQTIDVNPGGLTYGYFDGISAGYQRMEILAADGSVLLAATGGRCISSGCPDCIYNLNPVVVGFEPDTGALGTCPQRDCSPAPSTNESIVYVDPIIWTEPNGAADCIPPCILVLPPSVLAAPTTITFPPFVTTLEVGWITTYVVTEADGSVQTSSSFLAITTTTTLSIPDLTTTAINFWNVEISSSQDATLIYPTTSILPPAFIITDTYPAGITEPAATRTINPPAYPYSAGQGGVATTASSTNGIVMVDGQIITVGPGGETTTVEPGGQVVVIGSTRIIVDGSTVLIPTSTETVVDGVTLGAILPFITFWPTLTVETYTSDIPTPTYTSVGGSREPVIPCTAWFFFVSVLLDFRRRR